MHHNRTYRPLRCLVLLAALLQSAACVKMGDGVMSSPEKMAVQFDTYGRKPLESKADASYVAPGGNFAVGAQIGVCGFRHDGGTWASETSAGDNIPDFMFNQLVVKQEDGSWTYRPIKYWPNEYGANATSQEIDRLSFWGYYPYGATGLTFSDVNTSGAYTNASSGLPKVTFTQSHDPASQVDVMFSEQLKDLYRTQSHIVDSEERHYGAITGGQVTLNFRHALALVDFRLKEGTGATVNSMKLSNIKDSGTCLDPGSSPLVWDTTGSSEYTMEASNVIISDRNLLSLILIPQQISADATFTLNYDIRYASSDGTEDIVYKGDSFSVKLFKNTGSAAEQYGVTAWEPGHHYIYWITAGLDRIEFEEIIDAAADDWTLWTDPYDSSNHDIDVQ